ncbi:MAG: hypothetical protein IT361_12885 [Gemmatimonadaceae bacterium]|nr:hypothetical protein [Gemmatimonadaceae bacterium]
MNRGTLLLLALVTAPVGAQRTTYAPLAVQLPLSARTAALGGLNLGTREPESALGNPSLAGTAAATSVTLAHYASGARAGTVATTTPIGAFGVGIAVSYLDYASVPVAGEHPITDEVLVTRGTGAGASMTAALAMSTAWKGWRWGAAATYLEERVDLQRASAAAVSVGAARDAFWRNMTLGVALQNIGQSIDVVGSDPADVPLRLAAGLSGLAIPIGPWIDINVLGGAAVRRDGLVSGNLAAEVSWVPIEGIAVAGRAGVRRAELNVQRPMTLGGGLTIDRFALDYGWEQLRSGGAHRLGLRIR